MDRTFSNSPPLTGYIYPRARRNWHTLLRKRTKPTMIKQALILGVLLTVTLCEESHRDAKRKRMDPFAALDHHLTHTLAQQYMWPWNQLFRVAAALDMDNMEEPQQTSDDKMLKIKLHVKSFKPEELSVKVKGRNIIVEGKQNASNDHLHFLTSHFVQRFVLPPGSEPEEVTAVFNSHKSVLLVLVPRHEVPPPVERIVPIEMQISESSSVLPILIENNEEKKKDKKEVKNEDKTEESMTENKEGKKEDKKVEKKEEMKEEMKDEKKEKFLLKDIIEEMKTAIKGEKKREGKPTSAKTASAKPVVNHSEHVNSEEVDNSSQESLTSTVIPLDKLEIKELTTHVGKIRKKELKENTKMTNKKANEVSKGLDGNGLDYLLIDTE